MFFIFYCVNINNITLPILTISRCICTVFYSFWGVFLATLHSMKDRSEAPHLSCLRINEAADRTSPQSALWAEEIIPFKVSRDSEKETGCISLLPPLVHLIQHHARWYQWWTNIYRSLFIWLSTWVVCNQLVLTWDHNVLHTKDAVSSVAFLGWDWRPRI